MNLCPPLEDSPSTRSEIRHASVAPRRWKKWRTKKDSLCTALVRCAFGLGLGLVPESGEELGLGLGLGAGLGLGLGLGFGFGLRQD